MINKIIFWNIRSIRTQKSFERLVDLHKRHQYSYIALLEPFHSPSELEAYRRKLGLPNARVNYSSKIWVFWEDDWVEKGSTDSIQQLTMQIQLRDMDDCFRVTAVYARCRALERLELWEDLEHIVAQPSSPWLVGGNFNTIVDELVKLGGLPVTQHEMADFAACINVFLNFWTKHKDFMKIVEESWIEEITGSPFFIVHSKLKRTKMALSKWSKKTFGNIFQKIATLEDVVKTKEVQLEISPTVENRSSLSKAEAELKRYLHIEEEYRKHKASMKWFMDGDKNTKFFHAYVKGRRRKLQVKEI